MARRRVSALDASLEAWARWCADDSAGGFGGGGSMLARWMENKGHMVFGSGGGSRGPVDTLETRIEAAVYRMGKVDQMRADVLRFEYAAGWSEVVVRRGIQDYDPQGLNQLQNALYLNVSVRTYRTRLAEARASIGQLLGMKSL